MASYKIYFLDFCHQNRPSCSKNCLAELQNATDKAYFLKKVIFTSLDSLFVDSFPWNNFAFF